jgi:hypothetical protein
MRSVLFAIGLVAGCGVEIDGDRKGTSTIDAQPQADAAIDAPPARPCAGGDMNMSSGGQCYVLFTSTKRTWA